VGKTVSVLVRGSNKLMLDEAERSLHDALAVVRSIVKEKYVTVRGLQLKESALTRSVGS
jgi:T-complex protein 1 subunit delta